MFGRVFGTYATEMLMPFGLTEGLSDSAWVYDPGLAFLGWNTPLMIEDIGRGVWSDIFLSGMADVLAADADAFDPILPNGSDGLLGDNAGFFDGTPTSCCFLVSLPVVKSGAGSVLKFSNAEPADCPPISFFSPATAPVFISASKMAIAPGDECPSAASVNSRWTTEASAFPASDGETFVQVPDGFLSAAFATWPTANLVLLDPSSDEAILALRDHDIKATDGNAFPGYGPAIGGLPWLGWQEDGVMVPGADEVTLFEKKPIHEITSFVSDWL